MLSCSFCGKAQQQVKKLIAGPKVYICDECVCLSAWILKDEGDLKDESAVAAAEAQARAAYEAYEQTERAHWEALQKAVSAFRAYRRAAERTQGDRAMLAAARQGATAQARQEAIGQLQAQLEAKLRAQEEGGRDDS